MEGGCFSHGENNIRLGISVEGAVDQVRKLINTLDEAMNGDGIKQQLHEKRTDEELIDAINNPSILPDFVRDGSVRAWLLRISTWGKLNFLYVDPEHRLKKKVSYDEFFEHLTDKSIIKDFGTWDYEQLAVNKMQFTRTYPSIDGNKYTEKYILEIDLLPELKAAIKRW